MHFSIPDTEEISDTSGPSYKVFNVHVNGVLHCCLRYSQLHGLNEQLCTEFKAKSLPTFPPKKLWLQESDLEERRVQLEKYIQLVSQDPRLSTSDTFNTFLSKAQQETRREVSLPVTLNVHLLNGSKVTLNIHSTDQTDEVLENVMVVVGLAKELTYYFGLFLVRMEGDNHTIIRQLQEFEAPFISLKSLKDRRSYQIILRKSYWDQCFDEIHKTDRIALNLLQAQAECDVRLGWTSSSQDAKLQLASYNDRGSKKEYLELCQTLQNYGCIQFKPCISDFPENKSRVIISAGNYEIKYKILTSEKEVKEAAFSVTRIKCWKVKQLLVVIYSLSDDATQPTDEAILQFEYLFSKDNLKWITIQSEQAIMLSMCIKSMVDELIRKRKGEKIRKV
uniref:PX domain-containing protein n=1 Tax=Ciona savignyi TaxID=51511 RepID=H2YYP5_CIOSA